ncbi:MAG: dienelactone hydrolase family protein [Asticcacaulis sp.]|nr:dienelactone hydrolase family protein [Asticcacaulis sp.]
MADTHLPLTRPEGSRTEDFHLSRRGLAGLFFAGYALSTGTVNADAIHTPEEGLFTRDVLIPPLQPEGDYKIPGYLAMPNTAGKHPVILVVTEVFGVHDYIRDVCRRFAQQGYCALTIDYFARKGNAAAAKDFDTVKALVEAASYAQVMGDLQASVNWLKSAPDVGQPHKMFKGKAFADMDHVGITGFCWGGATVWMAAATMPEIRAGVAWYGRLEKPAPDQFMGGEERPWPIDIAEGLTKPVLGLYAENDSNIPLATVQHMNDVLSASHKSPSQLVVMPGTQHGFHADYRSSYNAEQAQLGWKNCLDWFRKFI